MPVELAHRIVKTWRFHTRGAKPLETWRAEIASLNGWDLAFRYRDLVEELWPGWLGDLREQHMLVVGMASCFEIDPFVTPGGLETVLREAKARGLDPLQANVTHSCIHTD